ncbi:MAG: ankyrin repeat domain-containing protein [Armatimonadota bacterium]
MSTRRTLGMALGLLALVSAAVFGYRSVDSVAGSQGWNDFVESGYPLSVLFGILALVVGPVVLAEHRRSRLYRAAASGDVTRLRRLVRHWAYLDGRYRGATILSHAAAGGHLPCVELLLEAGALPDATGARGWTPLMSAALNGREAVTARLLRAGADPNRQNQPEPGAPEGSTEFEPSAPGDPGGWTPLLLACWSGDGFSTFRLLAAGAEPNHRSGHGYTALGLAAERRHFHLVRYLLEFGADPHLPSRGQSPFEALLGAGPPILALYLLTATRTPASTALPIAVRCGRPELVEELLRRGADPNAEGGSALVEAVYRGDAGLVRLLLERGADPSVTNHRGEPLLQIARRRSYSEVAALLESAGSTGAS